MGKRDFETLPRYYKMGQFSRSDAGSQSNLVVFLRTGARVRKKSLMSHFSAFNSGIWQKEI